MEQHFFDFTFITWSEALLRIFLAMGLALLIGLERDYKGKPIEFRAYIIVAVTTCMLAMMGQELYADFSEAENVITLDLGKMIAGVLTGIGFLGAGAIIKRDDQDVVGSATGASIWASGGMGLAIGFGFYGLALMMWGALLVTLIGGGLYMRIFQDEKDKEKS